MSIMNALTGNLKRTLLGIILLIVGACFLVDWLVVTDEEKIEAMLLDTLDAYLAHDVEGVMASLSSGYTASWATRAKIRAEAENPRAKDASLSMGKVIFDEGNPDVARARVSARGVGENGGEESMHMKMDFRREGDTWKIARIEPFGTGM